MNATDNLAPAAGKSSAGAKATLLAGLLAGLTASACCAGPFLLLMLGISGSWIGNLSALEPVRPIFIAAAVVFVGLAYRKIYRQPAACAIDSVCATTLGKRSQKFMFWVVSLVIVLSIAFPWYGPLMFD